MVVALARSLEFLRKDKGNIPYVSIAYDGQEDASIELRLQAFMHQAYQYAEDHNLMEITSP